MWYITNILNDTFSPKYGIYQVKNEYHNAELYYEEQEKITEKASNYIEKEKKVKLNKTTSVNTFLIDLETLAEGSD